EQSGPILPEPPDEMNFLLVVVPRDFLSDERAPTAFFKSRQRRLPRPPTALLDVAMLRVCEACVVPPIPDVEGIEVGQPPRLEPRRGKIQCRGLTSQRGGRGRNTTQAATAGDRDEHQ